MRRIHLALIALIALLCAPLAFGQGAPMLLPGNGTLLQVNAHGETHRTPDVAEISAGVVTQNLNANTALRADAERMTAVVAALKQSGVAERDIQTSSINLQPQYDYRDNKPRITGYQVTNTVNVRLRELAKTGDVLDALVKQGANQINGPTFSVDKPEAAMDEARTAAITQARSRADLYASATGLKVRRIVSISEGGDMGQPRPLMMLAMASDKMAAAPTPIAVGENTLGVDVNVVFELGQ